MPEDTDAATDRAMVRTCRLALAVAAQDQDEIRAVVDEVTAEEGAAPLLLTTMAGTIATMMQSMAGSNWRQAMEETIISVRGELTRAGRR